MATWHARILASILTALGLFNLLDAATTPGRTQEIEPGDAVAGEVLPYAYMSEGAYGQLWGTSPMGWSNIGDWQTIFTAANRADLISAAAKSGFYAMVYRNPNGDITIAYRGTVPTDWRDIRTDFQAWQAQTPDQFRFARELAMAVKKLFPNSHVAATGHSLGGALAAYAGQQVPGISKVVTFNAARFGLLSAATRAGTDQINIIVPGDWVGDPRVTSSPTGLGSLSGKTYSVPSTTATAQTPLSTAEGKWDPYASDKHSLAGTIGGLKSVIPSQGKPTGPPVSGNASGNAGPTARPAPSTSQLTAAIKPPAPEASSTQNPAPTQPPAQRGTTVGPSSSTPAPSGLHARPGGISLTKAAAERMPLNITLDGSYYSDGRIVLMGKPDPAYSIDAALFLTSLRLACESVDPYFSLDPDDGSAWNREGEEASAAFWKLIEARFAKRPNIRQKSSAFSISTISARRDYPQVWASMEGNYPNLKSKLVFRPTWLRETRFGEILYKGDVLLKELSGGVSVLEPGPVRASKIEKYVPSDSRFAAQGLLASYEREKAAGRPSWQGHRLWFDLTSFQPRAATYPYPALLEVLPLEAKLAACRT